MQSAYSQTKITYPFIMILIAVKSIQENNRYQREVTREMRAGPGNTFFSSWGWLFGRATASPVEG